MNTKREREREREELISESNFSTTKSLTFTSTWLMQKNPFIIYLLKKLNNFFNVIPTPITTIIID
jgi:hypothetical protein